MLIEENEYLAHYGVLRRSGRYPWGSGGPEYATNRGFLGMVDELKHKGLTDQEICVAMGIGTTDKNGTFRPSTTQLRAAKSVAKNEVKLEEIAQAQKLRDKGTSNVEIGRIMGKPESSVRALLEPGAKDKADILMSTANLLKSEIDQKGFLDVGKGMETQANVSDTKFTQAVAVLREEGYKLHYVKLPTAIGNETITKVLTKEGVTYSDVIKNRDNIRQISGFSEDSGRSYLGLHPPIKINPNRVDVVYSQKNAKGEEIGGGLADGVIYVRPGVDDVSLGKNRYAQVRIMVGKDKYLKGMAMYKDDLPDGVDLQFNTNKSDTGNKLDAMKTVKKNPDGTVDMDNPFGSMIESQIGVRRSDPDRIVKQLVVRESDGTEKVTSAMNIVNAEGNWGKWSRSLPAQMLSKQSPTLAGQQLDKLYQSRVKEFNELANLTNPTVRRKLLETFGDATDSQAVHLRAAAINRQATQVILPITSMKDNEIYAPNFKNGEQVALIRFPHGGKFEIPDLKVNNNQPEAKKLLGAARDAVGIHPKVAERLSGADFDGDTVLVIPNSNRKIKMDPALDGLKGFDPQRLYKLPDDAPKMKPKTKQKEMGDVTNLITDMSLRGASPSELARAVKHSMVVIDAEKHHLDYKRSARDNNISELKARYQGKANAGASSLISRATSQDRPLDRKPRSAAKGGPIDRETGKRVYEYTDASYVDKTGKVVLKKAKAKSKKLAEVDDAFDLVTEGMGTRIEQVYAEHANRMKALANEARRISVNTAGVKRSPSAAKAYPNEVASLKARLDLVVRNAPLERQAQVISGATYRRKLADNPDMTEEEKKKIRFQSLQEARNRVGAGKDKIVVSEKEWAAIQEGAVSNKMLTDILNNADLDVIKAHATPRQNRLMSPDKTAQAKAMLARGVSRADVAARLGVSLTTLDVATTSEDGEED